MTQIRREPDKCAAEHFDVIVVGGGIYGCCLTLEAARRGVRVLLLERDDFGGGTSWNSLRIIHGGLRYLQQGNIARFHRSVREQAWWLHHFPELVQPLSCLMPLYNRGLHRTDVMQLALTVNDRLAARVRQRAGFAESVPSRSSSMLSRGRTIEEFPQVDTRGLQGGGLWWDAKMTSPPRLLIELLRWASSAGAHALNYTQALGISQHQGRVVGVRARCQVTQRAYEFTADHVVNCAGPWTSEFLNQTGMPIQADAGLAWAFNLVLDRPSPSPHALAIASRHRGGAAYFMVPQDKGSLLGTVHLLDRGLPAPTPEQVKQLIDSWNAAQSGCALKPGDVREVLAGRLPAAQRGSSQPAKGFRVVHHRTRRGHLGMTSVMGVKYTTARHVAEQTLRSICRQRGQPLGAYLSVPRPALVTRPELPDVSRSTVTGAEQAARHLQQWMQDESVVHMDDLLLRRCSSPDGPIGQGMKLAAQLMTIAGWDPRRQQTELARLRSVFHVDS